jgi:hypothetical protein
MKTKLIQVNDLEDLEDELREEKEFKESLRAENDTERVSMNEKVIKTNNKGAEKRIKEFINKRMAAIQHAQKSGDETKAIDPNAPTAPQNAPK